MTCILPSLAAALVACTSAPQEAAMPDPSRETSVTAASPGQPAPGQDRAALGPSPAPVSAAENPAPAQPAEAPAAADGRRILSTAFVHVGPDGHLTVKLRSGRVLVLRDVVMRRKDYCGVQALGGQAGASYCGGYAEVAAAQPGGALALREPDHAVANPIGSSGGPVRKD